LERTAVTYGTPVSLAVELSATVGTADMEGFTALQAKLQEWTLSGHERPD
jgi:hypothetical protein